MIVLIIRLYEGLHWNHIILTAMFRHTLFTQIFLLLNSIAGIAQYIYT